MITLSISPNYVFCWQFAFIFSKKKPIAFPGSLQQPSWKLAAILELSEHLNNIFIINFTFYMHKYIYDLKIIFFLTVRCHYTAQWHYTIGDGSHLGYWQPYWNDLNIATVFITLFEHLLWLKHKIKNHNYLFQPSAVFLRQRIWFQDSSWRPYWKMAVILKFCMARVFFLKRDPYRVFVPNLLLVS